MRFYREECLRSKQLFYFQIDIVKTLKQQLEMMKLEESQ